MTENLTNGLREQEQNQACPKMPQLKIRHSISISTTASENISTTDQLSEKIITNQSICSSVRGESEPQSKSSTSNTSQFNQHYNIISNYKMVEIVGRGSFGTVYRSIFLPQCQEVAVKVINFDHFENQYKENIRNFYENEVSVLRNLREKSSFKFSCHFYGAFYHEECGYIVMELLQGFSLEQLIQSEVQLSIKEQKFYLASLVLALEELHSSVGCIHRDIKPENLMILSSGELLLLDFGCAKQMKKNERTSSITGTCQYFSPSRFKCKYGAEADAWSLAVTAYELVTKKLPFCYQGIEDSQEEEKFMKLSSLVRKQKKMKLQELQDYDPQLQQLIEGLFNSILEEDFEGYDVGKVKQYRFFEDIDWNKLRSNKLTPPRTFSTKQIFEIKQSSSSCNDF